MTTITYLIISIIVAFFAGVAAGMYATKKNKEPAVGALVIDHESIPEDEPYLFLQSYVNPKTLIEKKTVILNVKTEKFVSQD